MRNLSFPEALNASRRNVKVSPRSWRYQKKFKLPSLSSVVDWQGRTTRCPTAADTSESCFCGSPPTRPATQAEMCVWSSLLPSLNCSVFARNVSVFPKKRKGQISTSITSLHFSSCQHRPPRSLLKTVGYHRKCRNTPT